MLTAEELDFHRTFGYVVAPNALADVAEELYQESVHALSLAYPDNPGGSLILPAMSETTTPCSLILTHDRHLLECVGGLLGPNAIVKPPKTTRFGRATNWHRE